MDETALVQCGACWRTIPRGEAEAIKVRTHTGPREVYLCSVCRQLPEAEMLVRPCEIDLTSIAILILQATRLVLEEIRKGTKPPSG